MSLMENSLSFYAESISKAISAESTSTDWKFAILLLVQAIETCLKEVLYKHYPVLVYANIDNPQKTVDINLALNRIQNICKINLNQKDIDCIATASKIRNEIVHYTFDLPIEQVNSIYVKLAGFYSSFCLQVLKVEVFQKIDPDLLSCFIKLEKYSEELKSRALETIKKENVNEDDIWECRICGNDTFVIKDGINTCYLCHYSDNVEVCPECNSMVYEDELTEIYTGNYKRIHTYTYFCRRCTEKAGLLENELF